MVRRLIEAPPEIVFSYFVEPEKHTLWQGLAADLEPRPGGKYSIEYGSRGGVRGEYIVLDPGKQLVFTWGWEAEGELPRGFRDVHPGESVVEVTLEPEGAGTMVWVRHGGFPTEMSRVLHAGFWPQYLDRLERVLTGKVQYEDPGVAVLRPYLEPPPSRA